MAQVGAEIFRRLINYTYRSSLVVTGDFLDLFKVSNIIISLMDNIKLLLIFILLLSHSFLFFTFYSLINICMVLFLFNNVCIFIVMTMYSYCMFMYGYPDLGFSVLFPQL